MSEVDCSETGSEQVFDFDALISWTTEEESLTFQDFPALEFSGGATAIEAPRKPAGKEMALGTAGSLLAHGLIAIAFILLVRHFHPPQPVQPAFLKVYLTEATSSGGGGTGGADPGHSEESESNPGAASFEEHPQEVSPPATIFVPTETAAVKEIEPTPAPAPPAPASKESPRKAKAAPVAKPKPRSEKPSTRVAAAAAMKAPPLSISEAEPGAGSGNGSDASRPAASATGQGEGSGTAASARASGPGSGAGEFEASAVDQPPRVLVKHPPAYPRKARTLGIGGRVVVRFLVDRDGQVSRPGILEAKPQGYFEQSALEAVSRWRFKPGCVKGQAVATWITLPVQFRLTEEE